MKIYGNTNCADHNNLPIYLRSTDDSAEMRKHDL